MRFSIWHRMIQILRTLKSLHILSLVDDGEGREIHRYRAYIVTAVAGAVIVFVVALSHFKWRALHTTAATETTPAMKETNLQQITIICDVNMRQHLPCKRPISHSYRKQFWYESNRNNNTIHRFIGFGDCKIIETEKKYDIFIWGLNKHFYSVQHALPYCY